MIFLLWAFCAFALETKVEVGWGGQAVVSAVNPLWLSVSNPNPSPFSGEVRISGKIGSPWRGEASYALRLPVFLAPYGRVQFLLPWPVELGMTSVSVAVFSEGKEVSSREVELFLTPGRLRGAIGPPFGAAEILLSAAEVPDDPLLLWPFSRLDFSRFPQEVPDAIKAWSVFLGGESPWEPPFRLEIRAEPFRQSLQNLRSSPPLWPALIPGIFLYLFALGPLLGGSSRGRPGYLLVLVAVFSAFSLFYSVWREGRPEISSRVVSIQSASVRRFCLELWGGVSWRGEEAELSGFWVEALPERGWGGLDLQWEYGPEGWRTRFSLSPGRPRVLLRLAQPQILLTQEGKTAPPAWLISALALPWEKASVERGFLPDGPRKTEAFLVLLP